MKKAKSSSCTGGLIYAAMVVATPALIAGGLHFGNQRVQIIGWILLVIVALPIIFRSRKTKKQSCSANNTIEDLAFMAEEGEFKPEPSTRAFLMDLLDRLEAIEDTPESSDERDEMMWSLTEDIERILWPKGRPMPKESAKPLPKKPYIKAKSSR